jgi:hypothetical protein
MFDQWVMLQDFSDDVTLCADAFTMYDPHCFEPGSPHFDQIFLDHGFYVAW